MNTKHLVGLLAAVLFATVLGLLPSLAEVPDAGRDMTGECTVSPSNESWLDGKETTYASIDGGQSLHIASEHAIGGLYIRFDRMPAAPYTVNGVEYAVDFLHKYIPIPADCEDSIRELEIVFDAKTSIADIFVLSPGSVPDFVQVWEPPCENADLLLAPTHADDDQLFFLGILPEYAAERDLDVQVVYYTNHNNVHDRPHELLNGLWTVGVRNYPVIAQMQDAWDGSTKTLEYGYSLFEKQGYTKETLVDFWVQIIRRFRPQVIVGHDIKGEYGHPQHMVNTDTLIQALTICGDAAYDEETEPYTPDKVYLHLYGENQITLDWDRPLSSFGGKTAYEVSREGYACHITQQWTWFTRWIKGSEGQYTKSTDITSYSPNRYGLYFTQVGTDEVGGDFFEHLTPRSQIPPETEPVTTQPPETVPVTTEPPATTAQITTPPQTQAPDTLLVTTEAPETPPGGTQTDSTEVGSEQEKTQILLMAAGALAAVGCGMILYALRLKKR